MLYLGLDAGGSKTKLVGRIATNGPTFTIDGGGANLQRLGMQAAAAVLAELVAEAIRIHGDGGGVAVCAGVAGAGRSAEQDALADHLQSLTSELSARDDIRIRVVHDAEIALEAAFHGDSGIIVIAGTGSVAFARTPEGRVQRVGGWGYLLGDEGSGHAVGLRGLNAVCCALDGGPQTRLTTIASDSYRISSIADAIDRVYAEQMPCQHFAPAVVDAARDGDEVALQILRSEISKLADQVLWLRDRCPGVKQRIALLGGLSGVRFYQDMLCAAIEARLPGWEIRRKVDAPCFGALRLAEKMKP